ncbi:hypothetical protein MP228_010389 [Amoeboaphelidium protococcarum]|nr:hypothetical protein MP228_010389 [Amoeboaphelidium protococcarum]
MKRVYPQYQQQAQQPFSQPGSQQYQSSNNGSQQFASAPNGQYQQPSQQQQQYQQQPQQDVEDMGHSFNQQQRPIPQQQQYQQNGQYQQASPPMSAGSSQHSFTGSGGQLQQHQQQQSASNRRRLYPGSITSAYTQSPASPGSQMQYQQGPPQQQQQYPQYEGQQSAGSLSSSQQFQPMQQQQLQQPYQQQQQQQQPLHQQFNSMSLTAQNNQALNAIPLIGLMPDLSALSRIPSPPAMPSLHQQMPPASAPTNFQRLTLNVAPQSYNLLSKSKLPFGIVINPFKTVADNECVPVMGMSSRQDPGQPVFEAPGIIRCKRCRTYINPYIQYVDSGHWRCNVCFLINDTPAFFDYDSGHQGGGDQQQSFNRYNRPEVQYSCIEYVAPQEYMVRPPQPPVYIFVIDVSYSAVACGMLPVVTRCLRNNLDSIPNEDGRSKVGFMAVDAHIHYFNLNTESGEPQIMVMSDLDDADPPMPESLLVNLSECRESIDNLLDQLPQLYQNPQGNQNAMGAGMQSALKMISNIGGKLVMLQSAMPSVGPGAVSPREDPKMLGTSAENTLLQQSISFYKTFAVECSRLQVSVDMFLFGNQYLDLVTLSSAVRYTAGTVYYYPGFNSSRMEDTVKFTSEMQHFLSRPMGLEAVLRVRASKGIRIDAFHGNFFTRSSDLLSLPTVSPDNSFGFQLTIEENLNYEFACIQTALLYTTDFSERRIRIITTSFPVVNDMAELFKNVDQMAMMNLLGKMAVERAVTAKLEDARDALINKCVDVLKVYKTSFSSAGQNPQLLACENLKLIPLMTLGLIKNKALRCGSHTPSDIRVHAMSFLRTLPAELSSILIYPSLYELHSMPAPVGLPAEGEDAAHINGIIMPQPVTLTSERFARHGLYLMDTFDSLILWVGRAVPENIIQELFDRPSYEQLQVGKQALPELQTGLNVRVRNIIQCIRSQQLLRKYIYAPVIVVKEDVSDPYKIAFLHNLIEDRSEFGSTYIQFLNDIRDKVNKQ